MNDLHQQRVTANDKEIFFSQPLTKKHQSVELPGTLLGVFWLWLPCESWEHSIFHFPLREAVLPRKYIKKLVYTAKTTLAWQDGSCSQENHTGLYWNAVCWFPQIRTMAAAGWVCLVTVLLSLSFVVARGKYWFSNFFWTLSFSWVTSSVCFMPMSWG